MGAGAGVPSPSTIREDLVVVHGQRTRQCIVGRGCTTRQRRLQMSRAAVAAQARRASSAVVCTALPLPRLDASRTNAHGVQLREPARASKQQPERPMKASLVLGFTWRLRVTRIADRQRDLGCQDMLLLLGGGESDGAWEREACRC